MAAAAIDLSHHLSELSVRRKPSPLKELARYMNNPDLISLAGGMPHPDYFPISAIHVDGLVTDSFSTEYKPRSSALSWLWNIFRSKERTIPFTIPKYPVNPADINLARAMQYDTAEGMKQLQEVLSEFTAKVYKPAYSDWKILCDSGNTDGWSRAVQTLCNDGEYIIAEEWTYPSAIATSVPIGVKAVSISCDGQGMRSDHLRDVLSTWDVVKRGAKRPHVMYTVPVGQNPTGTIMGLARKREIYAICVEYDVIIVEDDPYYFMQMPKYTPVEARNTSIVQCRTPEDFFDTLVPNYVSIDYQGRVIRLDTMSKTIAPGCRLGWITCNPMFAERILRHGETALQGPCGIGQAVVGQLLITWKFDGYARWLQGLAREYSNRRDFFVDNLLESFYVRLATAGQDFSQGCDVYDAYLKPTDVNEKYGSFGEVPLFSFVAPSAGMFVWIKFYFGPMCSSRKESNKETLEVLLWEKLAKGGVLFVPGWFFSADEDASPDTETEGHYRISFSNAEYSDMKKGIQLFADISRAFVEEHGI